MPAHGEIQDAPNLHRAHSWEYANAAARTAATGFVAADVGKLARQLDTNFLYMLIDDSPVTWQTVATGGVPAAHTHPSTDITDFAEAVDDRVGALVVDSSSIDVTYNDAGNAESLAIIDEYIRDLVGAFLVEGTGIDVVVDDALNTITITATGGVAPAAHTHVAADITDFAEAVDDRAAALFVAGSGVTLTYNDVANTLTVAASSGASGIPIAQWVSGNYVSLGDFLGTMDLSTAGNALSADAMMATPFAVARDAAGNLPTFNQVAVNVSNLIAASTIRLGVYAMGTDGKPGALIADWGTVSSATTGDKTLAISWAPAVGWYYLVQVSTHAPSTLRQASGRFAPSGHTGIGSASGATDWTRTLAGSSAALPNPFGAASALTTYRPIWLRVT